MKRTCLWLKNLPQLWYWDKPGGLFEMTAVPKPEPIARYVETSKQPGKARYFVNVVNAHVSSRTFPAIARAMAEQWGSLPARRETA